MKLSRKADYALRAVRHLADLPKDELGSINAVAEAEDIPREFLAKILKDLTRAGILSSYKGVAGGYRLNRHSREVSFLDVIEAVDGRFNMTLWSGNGTNGDKLGNFWVGQEKTMRNTLKRINFSKVRSNGRR
jgi:Rrf2 family protein